LADQALVQLTGEQRDVLHPGVVPEPVAGRSDHATATGDQNLLFEVRPSVDGDLAASWIAAQGTGRNAGRGRTIPCAHHKLTEPVRPTWTDCEIALTGSSTEHPNPGGFSADSPSLR
jgi:hypothetical protein